MKEPSVTEIKLAAGVPVESLFLGWLIHNPMKDDFLHAVRGSSGTFWTQTPETPSPSNFIVKRFAFSKLRNSAIEH